MEFLAFLVDGILLGLVYGVAALGLTLIWGVMNVINLAHGPLISLGGFGVYLLLTTLGLNPYLALVVTALAGLLLGIVIYWMAIRRVINAPHLSTLLATFAVNMIIIGLGTAAFSTNPRTISMSLGSLQAGPITVQVTRLIAAVASVVVAGLLYLFLYRTRPGKYVRAVANNRQAAELVGIPSVWILALSFGIGCMMATTAGGLIATIFPFTILSGSVYEVKSFVIVVLGGLGSPIGALIGGLILGMLEGIIPAFMDFTWVPVVEFGLFVLILLWRPSGLFGAKK